MPRLDDFERFLLHLSSDWTVASPKILCMATFSSFTGGKKYAWLTKCAITLFRICEPRKLRQPISLEFQISWAVYRKFIVLGRDPTVSQQIVFINVTAHFSNIGTNALSSVGWSTGFCGSLRFCSSDWSDGPPSSGGHNTRDPSVSQPSAGFEPIPRCSILRKSFTFLWLCHLQCYFHVLSKLSHTKFLKPTFQCSIAGPALLTSCVSTCTSNHFARKCRTIANCKLQNR